MTLRELAYQEITNNYMKAGNLLVPKRMLAKILCEKYPQKFKSIENTRTIIRDVTGTHGNTRVDKIKFATSIGLSFEGFPVPETISETESFIFPKKYKNTFILSDLHIPYHDLDALKLVLGWMLDEDPDSIILNGDILDFYMGSTFVKDPRKKTMLYEIEQCNLFIEWLKREFPKVKIFYKFGNHEMRFQTKLFTCAPMLVGLPMSDLTEVLDFKKHNITPIGYYQSIDIMDLTGYHGHEIRISENVVSPARSLCLKTPVSSFMGHCHRSTTYDRPYKTSVVSYYSVGCLCNMSQTYSPYCNGWSQGAMRIFKDKDVTVVENKMIKNGRLQ